MKSAILFITFGGLCHAALERRLYRVESRTSTAPNASALAAAKGAKMEAFLLVEQDGPWLAVKMLDCTSPFGACSVAVRSDARHVAAVHSAHGRGWGPAAALSHLLSAPPEGEEADGPVARCLFNVEKIKEMPPTLRVQTAACRLHPHLFHTHDLAFGLEREYFGRWDVVLVKGQNLPLSISAVESFFLHSTAFPGLTTLVYTKLNGRKAKETPAQASEKTALGVCASEADVGACVGRLLPAAAPDYALFGVPPHIPPTIGLEAALKAVGSAKSAGESSQHFGGLVDAVRAATSEQLIAALEDKQHLPVLVEAAAASSREMPHTVMAAYLGRKNPKLLRLYVAALQNARPTQWLIKDLMEQLESTKPSDDVFEVLASTLATQLRRLCVEQDCHNDDVIVDKFVTLLEQKSKVAQKPLDVDTLFRILENLGSARALPLIEAQLLKASDDLSPALRALSAVDPSLWSAKVNSSLVRILLGPASGGRSAAGLLLVQAERDLPLLLGLFQNVSGSEEREMRQLIAAKIQTKGGRMAHGLSGIRDYNRLAFGGMSGAFTANLAESAFLNMSYGLETEFAHGVIKRSLLSMDYRTRHPATGRTSAVQPVFTFALFSTGLESFVADSSDDGDDDEANKEEEAETEVSAGMQMGLFGAKQAPVSFFSGQGELMSAVWGADGTHIKAYESRLLLNDWTVGAPLLGGSSLSLSLRGSAALEIGGSVEVSIWYRNSHSVVSTQIGYALDAWGSIHVPGSKTPGDFGLSLSTGGRVDFVTDVGFAAAPYKMCMKMTMPATSIRQTIWSPGLKVSRTRQVGGRSFVTHPKVSQLCTEMFKESME